MSHASLLVILPPCESLTEVEKLLETALDPYDENESMPHRVVMPQDDVERMRSYFENAEDDRSNKIKYSLLNPDWNRNLVLDGRVEEWNGGEDPHPVDRPIGKSIEYGSTYNPRSKWDWWEIGGRWDGFFSIRKGASEDDFFCPQEDDEDVHIANIARYRAIDWYKMDPDLATFAILDARLIEFQLDAEWIENGMLGWFGTSSGEVMSAEEWQHKWAEIVHSAPDESVLVLVDYHI